MRALAVIPARRASSRLPAKPLAFIAGRPMVRHVYEASVASGVFADVIVATDDPEIVSVVESFGGQVELSSSQHRTGTDRVAEVAARHAGFDVVANVQGDQPFVTESMLRALVDPFGQDRAPEMSTIGCPLPEGAADDPHVVKVLLDRSDNAIYFSRAPVPYRWNPGEAPVLHHLGLYAFTPQALGRYAGLEPTPLEAIEGLEQLRALEHGWRIRVGRTEAGAIEVNTAEDLAAARAQMGEPSR